MFISTKQLIKNNTFSVSIYLILLFGILKLILLLLDGDSQSFYNNIKIFTKNYP